MNKSMLLLMIICFLGNRFAWAQSPHISGNVEVCIKEGSIKCDLLLSNVPHIKDYTIRLNSGFNIQYFRDSADKNNIPADKIFDKDNSYETFQYYFPITDTTKFLPKTFRIKYTGSFPVINDTSTMSKRGDWKGNIAFNDKTLRAADQSAWYPQLYDKPSDIVIDKYTYDLKVTCKDCEAIYVNGDEPKKGASGNFHSAEPVSMLLFAGNYSFTKVNGLNFINSPLKPVEQQLLSSHTNGIISFYEQQLNIPYGKKINYIATTAVSKNNSWLFVTYPSVVVVGNKFWDIRKLFSPAVPLAVDTGNIQTISHELGHYYFGTLFKPNSTLFWMFLEGTTEYISLQYTRKAFGETVYRQALQDYIKTVRAFGKILPISVIKKSEQIGEGYRYYYIPLFFTALEKNIGIEKTWRWLSSIVKDNTATTDYNYFKSSLLKAGMTTTAFDDFENKFINNEHAVENVIAETGK